MCRHISDYDKMEEYKTNSRTPCLHFRNQNTLKFFAIKGEYHTSNAHYRYVVVVEDGVSIMSIGR